MKKQRWRWTKKVRKCSGCYRRLDTRDSYAMAFGFCDVSCGHTTYGLSLDDFI